MKTSAIPKRGRKGSVVYLETRHGKLARQYVAPANPRSAAQVADRTRVRAVSARSVYPDRGAASRLVRSRR